MTNSQPVRILIVDDEPELREIMKDQLSPVEFKIGGETFHFEISQADSGQSALAQIETRCFDAIVTDINMPEKNGIELLAAVRGAGSDVPIIVLTSYGDKAKSVEALRLGCYAFLDKPWKADHLVRVIKAAAEQGYHLRAAHDQVESRVAGYEGVPDPRRRQLRNVFRSMRTGDEGVHRTDVSEIPSRTTTKKIV